MIEPIKMEKIREKTPVGNCGKILGAIPIEDAFCPGCMGVKEWEEEEDKGE